MNEEFEKWVRSKYPDAWLHRLAGSTDYMVQSMQYMWEAWQASRKQAVEECAKECEWEHDSFVRQATGGDSSGASDHRADGARACAEAIRALQKE